MIKQTTLTTARLERTLDALASIIVGEGERGRQLLPLYQRLENELAEMKAETDLMSAVRQRAKRSSDQTETRS